MSPKPHAVTQVVESSICDWLIGGERAALAQGQGAGIQGKGGKEPHFPFLLFHSCRLWAHEWLPFSHATLPWNQQSMDSDFQKTVSQINLSFPGSGCQMLCLSNGRNVSKTVFMYQSSSFTLETPAACWVSMISFNKVKKKSKMRKRIDKYREFFWRVIPFGGIGRLQGFSFSFYF